MGLTTDNLYTLAEQHNIHISWRTNLPHKGIWIPNLHTIVLNNHIHGPDLRCTLAHELAHGLHNHPAGHHPHNERQADETAATWLITPTEYALAEKIYGPHIADIAQELDVTMHMVKTWRKMAARKRLQPK